MDRYTAWAEIDSILESMDPNRSSWISLLQQQQQQQQQPQSLKSQLSSHEHSSLCPSVVPTSVGTRSRHSRVEVHENAADARSSSAAIFLMAFFVSLEDWAVLNRLEEVVPVLLNFGFDCASFINDVLTEDDLHKMGIQCPGDRRYILVAVLDLPKGIETVAASLSASATVETFMQRLCLHQYLVTDFSELRHCLVDCLAGVTDSELNVIFITEHRITDIYFVCQDSSLRTNFAYIIKDSSGGTHYCHCFASHSPDAAVLIINTLQEACSLADQLIEFNTGCCGISRSDGASS